MAEKQWLARYGTAIYVGANALTLLAALGGAIAHGAEISLGVYVWTLFALCSTPLLVLRSFNGRYALLGLFMGMYFLFFGALDLQHLVLGSDQPLPVRDGFLSVAELAILLSAALVLGGYFAGAAAGEREAGPTTLAEWPVATMLLVGIAVWVLGTASMVYFDVFVAPEKTELSAARGMAALGPLFTFMVMLGHMMQPLGILILSYAYARHRGALLQTLILIVVVLQIGVGFVQDVKIQAIMGGALVIMCRTLVDNRLPKGWIVGGIVFIVLAFPVFQAYRQEVTGERGLDRAQAFHQLGKVIDIVLASREKVTRGRERAQTFIERASGKESLELLFQHVGTDVEYLNGRSLVALPMAFVPRLLVPDKEDISVGLLFTKEVLKSDVFVYISISQLGELYWNFGWPAVFLGMPLIGFLLGFVGTRFSLERGATLTCVLVLLVTAQALCMGFGGTIPVAYIVWLRSMAAIGLMHLVFARRIATAPAAETGTDSGAGAVPAVVPARYAAPIRELGSSAPLALPPPRFPNLLR